MESFSCGDVVPGCGAHFTGRTDDEILDQVGEHTASAHAMTQIPAQVSAAVRSRIAETA